MCSLTTALTHFLVCAGATLLVTASALLGAFYGYVVGSHTHQLIGLIFATAALGGEILKPYAVSAALDAFGRWQLLRGAACALLAVVAIVYSVTSELGLAAASRGDQTAARQSTLDAAKSTQSQRERAQAELATLLPARDGLESQIKALKATPGANGCEKIDGPISRDTCRAVADLEIEAARAKRRAELEAALRSAPAAADAQPAVKDADPLAAALAAYLGALGWAVGPDGLSPWLLLIPVLFLELGSALGVVVVRSMDAGVSGNRPAGASGPLSVEPVGPDVRPEQTADARNPLNPGISDTQQTAKPDTEVAPTVAAKRTATAGKKRTPANGKSRTPPKGPTGPKGGHRRKRPASNVVDLLQRNGGRISSSQRGIAKRLGVSKSRANEVLHDLSSRGVVNLSTGRRGTVVSLAVA
ncbi:hypothetical protein [Hyphomicrobium sp. CS1BSMeth3]|uniref:hypothetical protein n=1 Tax=Hyphomicrobium sp. CS1BSMeth3 TaxID=1892844 RepID=UPI0009312643|nr:hypothetical protein [Hyphomicrobium sp. CS1BSMeth3]